MRLNYELDVLAVCFGTKLYRDGSICIVHGSDSIFTISLDEEMYASLLSEHSDDIVSYLEFGSVFAGKVKVPVLVILQRYMFSVLGASEMEEFGLLNQLRLVP